MNGVHDMGGMHGFGAIVPERHEPVFHASWEARVFALCLAMFGWGKWNIDTFRHAIERTRPADYLRVSYYEKWLTGLVALLEESGMASRAELESGHPAPGSQKADPPLTADMVAPVLANGVPTERPLNRPARFAVGQSVRARKLNPAGHTRLPRYARGSVGVVDSIHGAHVFPDTNAHLQGEQPQPLDSVKFSARELWGEAAAARDTVYLGLWEDYLEPV